MVVFVKEARMLIWPSNWANKKIEGFMGIETLTSQCYWRGDTAQSGYNLRIGDLRTLNQCYWRGNGDNVRLGTLWVHFERCSVGYVDTLDAARHVESTL